MEKEEQEDVGLLSRADGVSGTDARDEEDASSRLLVGCHRPFKKKALSGVEDRAGGGRRERSHRGCSRREQGLVLRSGRFKTLRTRSFRGPVRAFEESWRRHGQEETPAVGPEAPAAASWPRDLPSVPWSQPVPSP